MADGDSGLFSAGDEAMMAGVHSTAPPLEPRTWVQVLWDYTAQRDDDLTIRRGDVVEVVSMEGDWWIGTIDGRHGAFPSNYTQLLPDDQGHAQPTRLTRGLHGGSSLVSDYL